MRWPLVGQETMRRALLIQAIDPGLGGLLLLGGPGTGRSTAARALADLVDGPFVTVPPGCDEARLGGGPDLEAALRGEIRRTPGLLERAGGGVLFVDDLHLLPDATADRLLSVAGCILLATADGSLRPHLADRFPLAVRVAAEVDRAAVVRRHLAKEAENGPDLFGTSPRVPRPPGSPPRTLPVAARLPAVPESAVRWAVEAARQAGAQGHRGEIHLVRAARALAALDRTEIAEEHLREAAALALEHRRAGAKEEPRPAPPSRPSRPVAPTPDGEAAGGSPPGGGAATQAAPAEAVFAPASPHSFPSLPPARSSGTWTARAARAQRPSARGRTVGDVPLEGRPPPHLLALGATLIGAALRRGGPPRLPLLFEEVRVQDRRAAAGTTVVLLLDSSGSMGLRRRMHAAKAAALSLLLDSYRRRDRLGLVVARGEAAAVLLEPTRSPRRAARALEEVPTGGRSPLASGLLLAGRRLDAARHRGPVALLVISDGRANQALAPGGDAWLDALRAAGALKGVPSLLIDTEEGPVRLGLVARLAEAMGAGYTTLDEVGRLGGSPTASPPSRLVR